MATLLALLLVLASLGPGAPLLLARIGLIAPQAYQRDRQAFCPPAGPPAGLVSACLARRPIPSQPGRLQSLAFERLHGAAAPWRPWKLSRLLFFVGLPLVALIHRGRACLPGWPGLRPALPLLVSSGLAALISLAQPLPASVRLISLLPLLWLAPLLAAAPFATRRWLHRWARAAAWLLWLQLPLLLLEAWRGLPMPFGPSPTLLSDGSAAPLTAIAVPTRLVGSFIHPNSLGVAALVLLAFALSYRPPRAGLPGLWLASLICLLLARSATGLLGWLALLVWFAARQLRPWVQGLARPGRWPATARSLALALSTAMALLLLWALPTLLGRPDLWRSPLGRWQALLDGMAVAGPLQWMFGQGLAANSNQLLSLLGPQAALHPAPSDGMPVLLLLQSGLFGLMAFYGLLLWAWRRDQEARPFLLSVLLSSLTLNITELFPINLLLGLCLAGLLAPGSPAAPGPRLSPAGQAR